MINTRGNKAPTILAAAIVALICAVTLGTITTNSFAVGDSGKQIIVNNIQKSNAFGQWNNTDYTNFYNVKNLFDNQTNSWSFWGQYGVSGWNVLLEQPLKYPVCSVEIDVYNPKNTPYSFIIGNNVTMAETNNNLLDTTKEVIQINGDGGNCIQNVTAMQFMSNAPGNWTTLSEVKLFSNKTTDPGPIEPPVCPPNTTWNPETQKCEPDVVEPPEPIPVQNITKLWINNSTVYANITDSKVVLNSSGDSQVIVNNADLPPEVPPPPPPVAMTDDQTKEEKEEEEDEKEHEEESKEQATKDEEEAMEEADDENGDDDKN